MRVLERRPNIEARLFAEAQSLIDDGLDRGLVLELYPVEAPWLAALLSTTEAVIGGSHEEASWYFEASLKSRFIEAGVRRAKQSGPVIVPAPSNNWTRLRSGMAASGVAASAGVAGIIALGLVTADDAAPGDWNYAFKLGSERLDYRLSEGDARVSVQLNQTDARIKEIVELASSGSITQSALDRLEKEAETLTRLAQQRPLDEEQKDRLVELAGTATRVLSEVEEKQPELEPQARKTKQAVQDAAAAGLAGPLDPLATSTPAPSPSPSPEPSETATPTASPTATATETPTAEPTESPTPEATETPSATIEPSGTPVEEAGTPEPESR